MRYSSITQRIGGEGARAWEIHHRATLAKRRGEDVIILSIGDPAFETPDSIKQAAVAALDAGDTHYTDILGVPALREASAAYHRRTTGQEVTADNVAAVSGAQGGLFVSSMLVLDQGDDVVAPEPMYLTYEAMAKLAIARDLWVIADEVYAALTFGKEHESIASLPGMSERTVTINSLS